MFSKKTHTNMAPIVTRISANPIDASGRLISSSVGFALVVIEDLVFSFARADEGSFDNRGSDPLEAPTTITVFFCTILNCCLLARKFEMAPTAVSGMTHMSTSVDRETVEENNG